MEQDHKTWELDAENASKASFVKFHSNHPREYSSLFANLNKIKLLLDAGNKVGGFHVGFFRSEGAGVYRIGQTGVAGAKESRLYVLPDQENQIMHVLGIGTKETQPKDINEAKELAAKIRKISEAK